MSPASILSPPDVIPPAPPVSTRTQTLPFGELSWENFERLCYRWSSLNGEVEHSARYGQQGEAQEGIDIFARLSDGRYHCIQAKRHHSFGANKIREAVDLFIAGSWAARTTSFTITVQASLRSTAVQEEIESQATRLYARGIAFAAIDGDEFTERLRAHPELIDDFFGRPWVTALLGQDAANALGTRLDGSAFARIRAQLARVYEAQFQFFDPGSFGSVGDGDGRPALTLLERFFTPDMLVRETTRSLERHEVAGNDSERNYIALATATPISGSENIRFGDTSENSRTRRLPLLEWLGEGQRLVVLGEAGCGKSTLLRVIALDLLHGQTHFPELLARWGHHVPIYIPLSRPE
ncbi:hypothetical protein ACVW0Y_002689 [Pseudomonas sp. TE3786]